MKSTRTNPSAVVLAPARASAGFTRDVDLGRDDDRSRKPIATHGANHG